MINTDKNLIENDEQLVDRMALEALQRQAREVGSVFSHKIMDRTHCHNCGSTKGIRFITEHIGGIGLVSLAHCDNPNCERK